MANMYLTAVVFTLVFGQVFSNVILCEHHSGYISCTYPSRIYVAEAIYGRTTGRSICPNSSIKTTHCRSSTSDRKVKVLCNGRRICRLKADNRSYGDPCRGTYKYLEVKYQCRLDILPSEK